MARQLAETGGMDDPLLSLIITCSAGACFLVSAWATFWIWRARRGGWARLASTYPSPSRRDSTARRRQSVCLMPSGVGYLHLMTFRLTVDGLYAVPAWPVRFGHDPVNVPWEDIEIIAIDNSQDNRLYDLKFSRLPQVRMRVNVAAAQLIRRAADNSRYFVENEPVHTKPNRKVPEAVLTQQSVA